MAQYVKITPAMIATAEKYQAKILSTKTVRRRGNFTSLESKDRYFFGFLGELVFAQYLLESGKYFRHFVETKGKGVNFKFLVMQSGKSVRINIKATPAANHRFLMIPQNKFLYDFCDFYIGIRLDVPAMIAEIWGYISKDKLYGFGETRMDNGTLVYSAPLYELQPINTLTETLENDTEASLSPV